MNHRIAWPQQLTRRLSPMFIPALRQAIAGRAGQKAAPAHRSFMFAELAVYSSLILTISGVFLMFFFEPSMQTVRYTGPHAPLKGAQMSGALDPTLHVTFEVRGGLLMRQVHHWSALLFMAGLVLHMLCSFFTGAFRRPRRTAWVMLVLTFITGLGLGLTGYTLPDNMLSGLSLAILDGTVKSVRFIESALSSFAFGGAFPGEVIIGRLYTLHVLILPLLAAGLDAAQLLLTFVHKHTRFPAPGRTNSNVVGEPLLPTRGAKSGGFLLAVAGLTVLTAATMTINPVWLYGPADPGNATADAQPDWYFGFIVGALRLIPPGWELQWLGGTWPLAMLVPIALVGPFFAVVLAYPFLEGWLTNDVRQHHLLERPRNNPTRTAIGVAGMTFVGGLWGAGSADVAALQLSLSLESVIYFFRFMTLLGPFVAFAVTRRICLALQRKDREVVLHGVETGRIVRLPNGEFIEVHQPLDRFDRWRLLDFDPAAATAPIGATDRPVSRVGRLRTSLSHWFFEYRLHPVTPADLAGGPVKEPSAPEDQEDRRRAGRTDDKAA
ncbi:ubiquinol-cytochrome c reductase cytochrome b subunit [Arthrobacter sp. MSA 4-2]|uniref:cytochrome bc1 complex cytochrome b subunit n=1 Tax=Arthrobacter sp. MSA 4-2 TaxID=2794349 RepID=UPI0018E8B0C2|nr:cytochrome b N-terminal domain-containing protein [Arthrobacter sp. MSA 4-2]MBJ2121486.1 ubiquinol-cytochrome c reductase cytochrome b subunit [Arthrobacter sp. MSA 4-2]